MCELFLEGYIANTATFPTPLFLPLFCRSLYRFNTLWHTGKRFFTFSLFVMDPGNLSARRVCEAIERRGGRPVIPRRGRAIAAQDGGFDRAAYRPPQRCRTPRGTPEGIPRSRHPLRKTRRLLPLRRSPGAHPALAQRAVRKQGLEHSTICNVFTKP